MLIKKKKEEVKPVPSVKLAEALPLPVGQEYENFEDGFYNLKDHCFNCNEDFYVSIKKGTPKPKDAVCPFCLCADGK